MVAQAQELRCIPSIAEGLSNCFRRQNQSPDEAPEGNPGRNRRARIINHAKRATAHVPSGPRRGRRPKSPSSVQKPRPVSSPCLLLPRLSFGEALLDVDELFSSVSKSSNPTSLPSNHTDRSADIRGQRTQADEYREECVSRHPLEYATTEASTPASLIHLAQPPPHRTQNTALLETCITEMMTGPERRRASGTNRRVFDEERTQPIPSPTGSHGGFSLFPSTRQRTGNAVTPPTLIPPPEPGHPKSKTRLDSAALPASENHQASTLDPLGEECQDSGAHVLKQPAPVAGPSDQSNAKTPPANPPKSQDTSAIEEASLPVPDYLDIFSPAPSTDRSQPASNTLPLAKSSGASSLRVSKHMRCRPTPMNRPQWSQAPGTVAAANSLPLIGDVSEVVEGPSSSSRILAARSSPSPPPVSPCDLARD